MKIECSCGWTKTGKHKTVVYDFKGHVKRHPGHFEVGRSTSFEEYNWKREVEV